MKRHKVTRHLKTGGVVTYWRGKEGSRRFGDQQGKEFAFKTEEADSLQVAKPIKLGTPKKTSKKIGKKKGISLFGVAKNIIQKDVKAFDRVVRKGAKLANKRKKKYKHFGSIL